MRCYKIHKILPEIGSEIKFSSLLLNKEDSICERKANCLMCWLWSDVLICSTVSFHHLFDCLSKQKPSSSSLALTSLQRGNSSDDGSVTHAITCLISSGVCVFYMLVPLLLTYHQPLCVANI